MSQQHPMVERPMRGGIVNGLRRRFRALTASPATHFPDRHSIVHTGGSVTGRCAHCGSALTLKVAGWTPNDN